MFVEMRVMGDWFLVFLQYGESWKYFVGGEVVQLRGLFDEGG